MERVLYNNYYDGIISSSRNVKDMRINKYYYYMVGNRFVNEKDFLLKKY